MHWKYPGMEAACNGLTTLRATEATHHCSLTSSLKLLKNSTKYASHYVQISSSYILYMYKIDDLQNKTGQVHVV